MEDRLINADSCFWRLFGNKIEERDTKSAVERDVQKMELVRKAREHLGKR